MGYHMGERLDSPIYPPMVIYTVQLGDEKLIMVFYLN